MREKGYSEHVNNRSPVRFCKPSFGENGERKKTEHGFLESKRVKHGFPSILCSSKKDEKTECRAVLHSRDRVSPQAPTSYEVGVSCASCSALVLSLSLIPTLWNCTYLG